LLFTANRHRRGVKPSRAVLILDQGHALRTDITVRHRMVGVTVHGMCAAVEDVDDDTACSRTEATERVDRCLRHDVQPRNLAWPHNGRGEVAPRSRIVASFREQARSITQVRSLYLDANAHMLRAGHAFQRAELARPLRGSVANASRRATAGRRCRVDALNGPRRSRLRPEANGRPRRQKPPRCVARRHNHQGGRESRRPLRFQKFVASHRNCRGPRQRR
jgi:hypothetical protein